MSLRFQMMLCVRYMSAQQTQPRLFVQKPLGVEAASNEQHIRFQIGAITTIMILLL
jgi:hypothetical protein